MSDTALLLALSVSRIDEGSPGYMLENPFGQSVQVLPRPPTFRAQASFEWSGAMPDDIVALIARARAAGIVIGS